MKNILFLIFIFCVEIIYAEDYPKIEFINEIVKTNLELGAVIDSSDFTNYFCRNNYYTNNRLKALKDYLNKYFSDGYKIIKNKIYSNFDENLHNDQTHNEITIQSTSVDDKNITFLFYFLEQKWFLADIVIRKDYYETQKDTYGN